MFHPAIKGRWATLLIAFAAAAGLGAAAPTAVPQLAAFVGKYPFEKIGKISFLGHPNVKRLVESAAIEDVIEREVLTPGVSTPIVRQGSLIVSSACRPHNCSDVNWKITILVPNGPAAVCYHNSELMGERSRWFFGGFARFVSQGNCNSDDVPEQVAAALVKAS
jgi:hypothetical protein